MSIESKLWFTVWTWENRVNKESCVISRRIDAFNHGMGEDSEVPWDCEIKTVNPKGKQFWNTYYWKLTELKLKLSNFHKFDAKNWDSLGKTLLLGKIEGQGREGMAEDRDFAGYYHPPIDVSLSKSRMMVTSKPMAAVHGSQNWHDWATGTELF